MSEISKIEVWMNGCQVGTMALTPYRPQCCAFEYTVGWLKNGFSISPFELPLTAGLKIANYHPFEGLFGVFADSLPDGWGMLVLNRYLSNKGVNIRNLNVLEQLCLVGSEGRGALEYRPDRSLRNNKEFLDFEQLATETEAIISSDDYIGEHLEEIVERGGSPGGARPKIFMKNEGTEWLVKFRAKGDKEDIGRLEYEYSVLAKKCGIEMSQTKLFGGKWFGTQRFDRIDGRKIHVVTAGGLLQADYTTPCMDYSHLFALAERLTHSMEDMWKIYRLMCFNVLIGNCDDHARNFAFIYDTQWHFAPAYDILPNGGYLGYHTTSVNDNPKPRFEDIMALATKVGLDVKTADAIYKEIKNKLQA